MAGGGGGGWRWPVAGGGGGDRRWPVAVAVAGGGGEEGRKGYIGNKRLVPLSSTYFDGTSVFHLYST